MKTIVKDLKEILTDKATWAAEWQCQVIMFFDNMTYLVSNSRTKEAIFVDPVREDWDTQQLLAKDLQGYRFVAVIDTHTHADHISNAGQLAQHLSAPLVMHQLAPSKKVDLRVSKDTHLPSVEPIHLLVTPGHTHDGITPIWGPFVFTGDTILYGDTGRDDLPTGDPVAHYESLVKILAASKENYIILPGHDTEGGRASTVKTQLKENTSLLQNREDFVRDAGSYRGPSPKLLKESLFENFK